MNAVGVLSRADEIGGCRLDAMEAADRVARRYEADARLRRLCPVVVPVNGLLGHRRRHPARGRVRRIGRGRAGADGARSATCS